MTGALYHNRQGRPIYDVLQWAWLMEDDEYRQVGLTRLAFPARDVVVSTVWTGLSPLSVVRGEPLLIFETMVFGARRWEGFQWHWTTEQQAQAGHALVVEAVRLDRRPRRLSRALEAA